MINQWINAREFHHVFWAKQWRFQPSPSRASNLWHRPSRIGFTNSWISTFQRRKQEPRCSQKKPPARPSFSEDSFRKPMVWIRKKSINGGIFTTMLVSPFRLSIQLQSITYIWNIHEYSGWVSVRKSWRFGQRSSKRKIIGVKPRHQLESGRCFPSSLCLKSFKDLWQLKTTTQMAFHPLSASIFKLYPAPGVVKCPLTWEYKGHHPK